MKPLPKPYPVLIEGRDRQTDRVSGVRFRHVPWPKYALWLRDGEVAYEAGGDRLG